MPVTLHQFATYSTGSIPKSGCGIGLNGVACSGQTIGGDYGNNFDISSAFSLSFDVPTFGNEKFAMQNLNNRLASYLDKVLLLENTNLKLEQKIKEFYKSKTFTFTNIKDLSKYYRIIDDLRKEIIAKTKEKQEVYVKLNSAILTVSDLKMKIETENNIRLTVEEDLARLRVLLRDTETEIKNLQREMLSLREELVFLKKCHEEEMHMVRTQQGGLVNVQVDCAPAVQLNKELDEIRQRYEALIQKNHKTIEQWFQSKANSIVEKSNTENLESHTGSTSSQKGFSDLGKIYQTQEIEIKGIRIQIEILQKDLGQVGARYSEQLSQLQLYIDRLQTDLQQITTNMQQQALEYQLLLDIKMRLELEIAEYRRLLEGKEHGTNESNTSMITTVTNTVTKTVVEERQETQEVQEKKEHHIYQRRVKIITEKLVDGVVVSTTMEENLQDLPS